jgi:ectoine hydroxylase-related dioxygenase (phytanoyl-CoA dioxygenase family)
MSDTVAAFRRDGAVLLKGMLDAAQVATLAAAIDANLADPSPRAITASRTDDGGRFVEDFRNWTRFHGYRRTIMDSRLGEIAAALTGSATIRLHHDHMLTKEAGTQQPTPWHQDQPYYDFDGQQNVSFWIPVDPVPRAASLEFIAGSHLGPWLMPRTFLTNEARWFPEGSLAELPDVEADRSSFPIIGWGLEPGDAIAFHMLTLHSAPGSQSRRRAFSVRCIGDDVRRAPRPWRTSPDFPELGHVPAGARFDGPLFPLLWPTSESPI